MPDYLLIYDLSVLFRAVEAKICPFRNRNHDSKFGYLLPNAKLQVFGRYEVWQFAELNGIFNKKITWTGYGINYYVKGQDLRLTLEYSTNDYDKEDTLNKDFNTMTVMLQFRI